MDASERAAARTTFQLTYGRSPVERKFFAGQLTGPSIPNAYADPDGTFDTTEDPWCVAGLDASGDWEDGPDGDTEFLDRTEDGWIDRYANYAINEAVHEALEWLRVDGLPWLDPHGDYETAIYGAVNDLASRLTEIRACAISAVKEEANADA